MSRHTVLLRSSQPGEATLREVHEVLHLPSRAAALVACGYLEQAEVTLGHDRDLKRVIGRGLAAATRTVSERLSSTAAFLPSREVQGRPVAQAGGGLHAAADASADMAWVSAVIRGDKKFSIERVDDPEAWRVRNDFTDTLSQAIGDSGITIVELQKRSPLLATFAWQPLLGAAVVTLGVFGVLAVPTILIIGLWQRLGMQDEVRGQAQATTRGMWGRTRQEETKADILEDLADRLRAETPVSDSDLALAKIIADNDSWNPPPTELEPLNVRVGPVEVGAGSARRRPRKPPLKGD